MGERLGPSQRDSVGTGWILGYGHPSNDGAEAAGGFVEYQVDDTGWQRSRGPARDFEADGLVGFAPTATSYIGVGSDGTHTVVMRASDVAGNVSAERRLSFKVDRTAPELAVFETQQASDPTLITVAASDRTSGLADGGQIRFRRIAPDSGPWITLRASRVGERY